LPAAAPAARARSTDPADYQRVGRPVAAMAKEFPDGFHIAPHRHERAQLVFAIAGVMRVATASGAWIVPSLRAVWIPPATEHEIRMLGDVAMRTLYVTPEAAASLPESCAVIEVSRLLRELILGAVAEPVAYRSASRADLIMRLILMELRAADRVPLGVPLPQDKRLLALCRALIDDPASDATLESWAERVGASSRTLVRLFRRETGLSFGLWRQQARLAAAVALLAVGEPVAEVARRLGYDSASAFTAMFRRTLGETPKRYLSPPRPTAPG